MSKTKMINIRKLKEFAFGKLPNESLLRDLLLMEKDELTAERSLPRSVYESFHAICYRIGYKREEL